jgi:signal transduction histidine kinase
VAEPNSVFILIEMKKILIAVYSIFIFSNAASQWNTDSLRNLVLTTKVDSTRLKSLVELTYYYKWVVPDSAIYFSIQAIPLAKQLHKEVSERDLYFHMGEAFSGKGNFALALETQLKGLKLAEKIGEPNGICWSIVGVGSVYFYSHDYENALNYYRRLNNYPETFLQNEIFFNTFIGEAYFESGKIDSAFIYINHAYELIRNDPFWPVPFYYLGKIYAEKNQFEKAISFYREGINYANVELSAIEGYIGFAKIFNKYNKYDSAIFYARKGLDMSQRASFSNKAIEASVILKDVYKKLGYTDSAFKYQEIMLAAKDSVYSQEKVKQMQYLGFREQLKQQEIIAEQNAYQNRIRIYALIAAIGIFLIIATILWRNNRQKQKAYLQLQQEQEKLKSTQTQLIQSEKMASLGALTAGIAHEIQNPLNFVNNFSEVSNELIDEMKDELNKGDIDEAKFIADDIKQNLEKINHHGKRADAIVKGMLQHSRKSSGIKEPTDINKLADEYLRLSYHGLRAKEKDFNAEIKTEYDNTIGKINIVPQDIGRVLLNLINNAFYAVNEKKKTADENYKPEVSIKTKKIDNTVELTVEDNGNGVPASIKDKIFQPFFTTKPTGGGTGLGLSLSYDIIKAHGGEIKVETKEGLESKFIIDLSLKG